MASAKTLLASAIALAVLPFASAGYNSGATDNIAVYWGQNSYNQGSGQFAQQRLAYYCANTDIDIIPIAFMNGITPAITNFANAGDNCTAFASNSQLLDCPQIEEDIKTCQQTYHKTILLSLGGATYSQGGWSSSTAAQTAAQMVWDMFGPVNSASNVDRPFGTAVVDGFDFDFESGVNNIVAFGQKLRSLMDGATGKPFYLTSAPQCVYPDAANGPALAGAVAFDFIMIQFYNNWCGTINFNEGSATQNAFNFDVWDNWAHTVSANPNVKILLGIPANTGAGGGYTSGSKLAAAIKWSKQFSSFGGVMMWDMSQLYANTGFLGEVVNALKATSTPPQSTSSTPPQSSTSTTSSGGGQPTGALVPQWGQCGGEGYTGPTQCQPPYKCVPSGQWWSSCQ